MPDKEFSPTDKLRAAPTGSPSQSLIPLVTLEQAQELYRSFTLKEAGLGDLLFLAKFLVEAAPEDKTALGIDVALTLEKVQQEIAEY